MLVYVCIVLATVLYMVLGVLTVMYVSAMRAAFWGNELTKLEAIGMILLWPLVAALILWTWLV